MARRILQRVDLQPHRTRYWRTARLDGRFRERAEKVLWCYANAPRLARHGIWVVCTDEMPNLQILERDPIRRAVPGSVGQREFESTRHGTVNLLLFLTVHTGRMELAVLGAGDAAHYIRALAPVPPPSPSVEGCVLGSRRRPQSHSGRDVGLPGGLRRVVASAPDPGPRVVAQPSGAVGQRFRWSLPEGGFVVESGRVHRSRVHLLVGVQPALCASIRVDMDQ